MAGNPGTVGDVLSGAIAGTGVGAAGLSEEIARLADQLQQLQTASQAATASMQASSQRTSRSSWGGASSGQSIGSTLLDVLGGAWL